MPIGGYGVLIKNHSRDIIDSYATASTDIPSGATANAFGAWVQLFADIGDRDILIVELLITSAITTLERSAWELGIGASSSESRIFGLDIPITGVNSDVVPMVFSSLNIRVPSGSRLSARVKDSTTAGDHFIAVNYIKL